MDTLADILKTRIQELGFQDIKECARRHDIPYELLRKVISDGHLPKDKTLQLYADKLELELGELISTTYRQRAPSNVTHLFRAVGADPTAESRLAPVLGRAACGPWLESYESETDVYEPVEQGDPDAFFVIAEGDSMVGGHIPPGALLLVSPSAPVSNGKVVLARLGAEEFTVKTLHRQADGATILQPMNPAYEPIVVPQGAAISVMRITEVRIKL